MISADSINKQTFSTVRFKEGYSVDEVDDFLDEIIRRMRAGDPTLAASIQKKTFLTVRFKEGYDVDEVDDFLDEVVHSLEATSGAEAGAAPSASRDSENAGPSTSRPAPTTSEPKTNRDASFDHSYGSGSRASGSDPFSGGAAQLPW